MSSNLFKMFDNDKKLEADDGILINYGDVRFRIARAGGSNQKFKKVFAHVSKPYRRQIDNEQLSDEASDRLMAEVYAKAVILGWETLKKDDKGETVLDAEGNEVWMPVLYARDGTALDFNEANCIKILLDLPELFADLKAMAAKAANFRKGEDEEDRGN